MSRDTASGSGPDVTATLAAWTLHGAAIRGRAGVVRLLLDRGANVNARTDDEQTPLHRAAGRGHLELVCLLLDAGAALGARDEKGRLPLGTALMESRDEVAALLRERSK